MKAMKVDIIASAMRNRNIVIIITTLLMIIGVIALMKMPRNEYPQFTIRQGVIVGIYPGASSAEVEAQLTRNVENYIFGYQEINKKKTYSQSKEGVMYIFVELNDNVKNADQFWSKLKHGLSELKMTLPSGVMALIANSDFGDTSALLITLSSDTKSYKDLEEELKKLEAECRKIPATSKIKHYGLQKEKIYVNVKPELLNEYNIKTISLLGSYRMDGMVNYAGSLKDGKNNLAVHLPASFESEKDLANQIVYSDPLGNIVRLKNIASIDRRYEDPDNYIKQNGKKTILLSLEMQPGNNIVEFGKDVDDALASFGKTCPKDITVAKISELPKYVNDSISNFMLEFLIAIVAVILVTMLLLPLRIASVAGITVPISVLITLALLYFFGVELHMVSLSSLIVVLGMIVDNSIVVIDNHVEKIDHGGSAWHAAIKSARELFIPIVTATLAILAAYIPLGFMLPGTAGEFVETLPIVISTALIVSILVACLLVPYLNFLFIKKGLSKTNTKKKSMTFLDRIQNSFDKWLEKAFKYPKTVIASVLVLLAISVILFKGLDQQLFPEVERNQFAVEIYLPTGSSLESTAVIVDSVGNTLMRDQRVTNVTSFFGTSSPRFHAVYAPNMPASNYGQLLVNTISEKATREIVKDYNNKFSDAFVNAHVSMKILALSLSRYPIEIRITSDSIKDIRTTENNIKGILKDTRHIHWIQDDWDQKLQNIRVNLDRDKANRMGYSKTFVSTSLMIGLEGLPLTTIWENDYPVEVRLSQENNHVKDITLLEDQYITSLVSLKATPLRSFANFTPEWTEGAIIHRNGIRTLTISVENESGVAADEIFKRIKPKIDNLSLPEGTTISYGGEYDGQKEVFNPMILALGISILVIFFILLFQFKKVKLSLLILSTMLLPIPGAALGLVIMGYPFSMTAFIGITSLCGLVVRNGIILIDYLVKLRKETNMTVYEAALAAGKRRMRPIFLTSAAAAVGVIPMILSRSLLWGPMGTVICFGLLIAMVLTLFLLPILYWLVYKGTDKKIKSQTFSKTGLLQSTIVAILLFIGLNQISYAQPSFSLDQCKKLALENNILIKNGNIEIKAAKQVKQAAYTKYFPNISATGMIVKFNDPLIKFDIPGGNLPVYNGDPSTLPLATEFAYFPGMSLSMLDKMKTGAVMATQPVFAGGRICYGNELASLGMKVSNQKLIISKNEVLNKAEEQYWQIVSLHEKMKTIDRYNQLLDTLLKDVNNAYNAGLVNHNDVLKVTLKQNELRMNKLKLDNGQKLATMAFCQYIGIAYDPSVKLTDSISNCSDPRSLYINHQQALPNRVEYQLLQESIRAEKLQSRVKRGEYLPEMAVGVGAFTYDISDQWNNNMMAFGSLSIPISNWWEASHSLKERKLKEQIAQNNASNNSELLSLQMEKAWLDLLEAFQQIQIAEDAIKQAKENLKLSNANYHAGITGISDLLEAQAILQNSFNNLTESRSSFKVKTSSYLQATGRYE